MKQFLAIIFLALFLTAASLSATSQTFSGTTVIENAGSNSASVGAGIEFDFNASFRQDIQLDIDPILKLITFTFSNMAFIAKLSNGNPFLWDYTFSGGI